MMPSELKMLDDNDWKLSDRKRSQPISRHPEIYLEGPGKTKETSIRICSLRVEI
jgi:hypothetical protein